MEIGEKIQNGLVRVISYGFGLFFLLLLPFLCGWHQNNFLRTHLTPWKVALFAALFLLLLWGAAVWGPRLRKRLSKRAVTGVTLLVLLCLQFVFATAAYTEIGFDCGQLIQLAQEGEKALTDGYLLQFPNNVTLTLLWQIWWKLTQAFFSDIWFACIVLNILFVDAAIYFCCRIADRFYSERVFWITWVLAVLELGLTPYLLVPYSDTMAMPFVAGSVYAVMAYQQSFGAAKCLPAAAALGFCLLFGSRVKPTVAIVGIALLLSAGLWMLGKPYQRAAVKEFVHRKKTLKIRLLALSLVCFLAGGIPGLLVDVCRYSAVPREEWEEKAYSWKHFLMMGLSHEVISSDITVYGCYYAPDYAFAASFATRDEREQASLEVFKQRVSELGADGVLKAYGYKLLWSFSDGAFFYGREGNFHAGCPRSAEGLRGLLQNATYIETDFYNNWLCNLQQGLWLAMCILLSTSLFQKPRNILFGWETVLYVAVLGLCSYLMLFECRARYVLLFLPVFVILSAICGGRILERKLKNERQCP